MLDALLAHVAQLAQASLQLRVGRGDDAAVAQGAHHLGRVEAEGSQFTQAAGAALAVRGAVGVRGVLEDGDAGCCRPQRVHVHALAVEMHGQDGPRGRCDGGRDPGGIDVGGQGVHVHEDRQGAHVGDGEDRGHVGVGHGDDLVTGADAECAQGEGQGGGAGADADAGGGSAVGRELRLEVAQVGSQREAMGRQAGLEGLAQLVRDGGMPARHVLHGHGRPLDGDGGLNCAGHRGSPPVRQRVRDGRSVSGPGSDRAAGRWCLDRAQSRRG